MNDIHQLEGPDGSMS